jgi:TonB family protein
MNAFRRLHPLTALCGAGLLAAALLASAPAVALADGPKVIKKVPPEFPAEAVRKGVTDGVLKVNLAIDAQGGVTDVQVLEASPPKARIFTEAAVSALKQWKFQPSGKTESTELKLVFQQD